MCFIICFASIFIKRSSQQQPLTMISFQWCLEQPPSSSWCVWVSWWSWWSSACSEFALSIDVAKVPGAALRRAAANGTTPLSPSSSTLWRYKNKTKQSLDVERSKNLLSSIFPHSRPLSRTVLRVSHGHLCRHGRRRGGGRGSGGVTRRRQRRPADHHQEGGEGQQHPSLLSHMLSLHWVS